MPRRVPRPVSEPPYDDRRRGSVLPPRTQGALALDLRPAPRTTEPANGRRLTLIDGELRSTDDDQFFARQPTPTADLPDPKPFCARFVQALVEVLAGGRPLTQLMRWTSDEIYTDLRRRIRALTSCQRGASARATVRSVHVQTPRDGVAEASIHVRLGGQSRAIAIRLEGLDGHWRCTALQLG